MAETWLTTLPDCPLPATVTPEANLDVFEPEVGQPLTHPRVTHSGAFTQFTFKMTRAQVLIFDEFYRDTLQHGSLTFLFTDPLLQTEQEFKIRSTPRYEPFTPGVYMVTFDVYRLPDLGT